MAKTTIRLFRRETQRSAQQDACTVLLYKDYNIKAAVAKHSEAHNKTLATMYCHNNTKGAVAKHRDVHNKTLAMMYCHNNSPKATRSSTPSFDTSISITAGSARKFVKEASISNGCLLRT
jgi:hypothetical protein